MSWTLSDAKNRLSEVLDRTDEGEPQRIVRRGREFVVMRGEDYDRVAGETPTLVEHLMSLGPRFADDLETMPRDVEATRDAFDGEEDEAAA